MRVVCRLVRTRNATRATVFRRCFNVCEFIGARFWWNLRRALRVWTYSRFDWQRKTVSISSHCGAGANSLLHAITSSIRCYWRLPGWAARFFFVFFTFTDFFFFAHIIADLGTQWRVNHLSWSTMNLVLWNWPLHRVVEVSNVGWRVVLTREQNSWKKWYLTIRIPKAQEPSSTRRCPWIEKRVHIPRTWNRKMMFGLFACAFTDSNNLGRLG